MFQVRYLPTGEVVTVYGISGLLFLVWDGKGYWNWVLMDQCVPLEGEVRA